MLKRMYRRCFCTRLQELFWMISLALAVCLTVNTTAAVADSFTLLPTNDTFVYNQQPDNNFNAPGGTPYGLASGEFNYASFDQRIYLMFDLSSIMPAYNVTAASLYLYQAEGSDPFVTELGTALYHVSNDSWSESTLTWNNAPPAGASPIAFNSNGGAYRGWSSWNLYQNGLWNPSVDPDGLVSLRLSETYHGDQSHDYFSKDYYNQDPELRPRLVISADAITSAVPEPSTLQFVGTGLLALVLTTLSRPRRRIAG